MSEIKTNKISPIGASGTITLGDSGDTFTVPAGVTLTNNGTASGFGSPAYSANASASTGAVNIDASDNLQFDSGYGSTATAYGCRAWVNFNGTGTVAIRDSGNVSSITDLGTGDYVVNMSTALPDANYCALGTWSTTDANWNGAYLSSMMIGGTRSGGAYTAYYSTTQIGVHNYANDSPQDIEQINVAVFR